MSKNFNLATDIPIINNREDLSKWLKPLYIISDYFINFEIYEKFMSSLRNLLRASFDIKSCREYPIRFKFYKNDKKEYTLELRHFYINYLVWRPLVEIHGSGVINERFILDCYNDIAKINDFINNNIIEILREYHIKSTVVNKDISDSLYYLREISIDFALIMGLNFSIETFVDMYNKDDNMKELMEIKFSPSDQPHEIEAKLDSAQKDIIKTFINDDGNPIGTILKSGKGIKYKQLTEFMCNGGHKPTLDGKTIPKPMENSTLIGGLNSPFDIFIGALGALKSLVMNRSVMGRAGYFAKIVTLLARLVGISKETSDCNTKHLVQYEIKTKEHFSKLIGKYYFCDDINDYRIIHRKDTHLIGQKVRVRSAFTCACPDGSVCPKCIGNSANINRDIADGYAAFESEEITKVVNQSILSVKHLLTTNSEVIDFNPNFYKFFSLLCGEIFPNVNNNQEVENITDYAIYINPDSLSKVDEMEDNSLYNTYIASGKFSIINLVDKNEEPIEIKTLNDKEIYITNETFALLKKNHNLIKFSQLDDDFKLFEMVINNNELTKPLYQLMELLNKSRNDEDTINEDYNSLSQKFLDLLIESRIPANVIAAEVILNSLIRSEKHPYIRPNFAKEKLEPYRILTIDKALKNHQSILIGLCYQDIKSQLLANQTFTERTATSYLDAFFKVDIPTDKLYEYARMLKEDDEEIKELDIDVLLDALVKDNRSVEEFIADYQ